jgi:hypothetical protein
MSEWIAEQMNDPDFAARLSDIAARSRASEIQQRKDMEKLRALCAQLDARDGFCTAATAVREWAAEILLEECAELDSACGAGTAAEIGGLDAEEWVQHLKAEDAAIRDLVPGTPAAIAKAAEIRLGTLKIEFRYAVKDFEDVYGVTAVEEILRHHQQSKPPTD